MRRHLPLVIILLIYLLLGALYIRFTPPWQAPDEPAHYNYVRQLAVGRLPLMEPGDYNQDYLNEVVFESGFSPGYAIEPISYEDWQPPLYYLLQTPVYLAANGSLAAMRFFSLLLGGGVVILAYAIVRRIAPVEQWLALTAAVFVAFLPQHLAIMASVNNDALAELLIASILFLVIDIGMTETAVSPARLILLGLLLGLSYLTKASAYPLTLVVALLLLWKTWSNRQEMLRTAAYVGLPALLLGALWWGRNAAVYGGLDVMGKQRHDAVVVGQPRTAEWIAQFGMGETAERFVVTTFQSFWGQFGWMTVPMTHPAWLYPLLWVFMGIALVGLVAAAVIGRKQWRAYRIPILALVPLFVVTVTVHAGYNVQFVQHQGRYLFPALIPIAIGIAIGLGLWSRPLRERRPGIVYVIPLGLAGLLIALNFYAIFFVIVPALA